MRYRFREVGSTELAFLAYELALSFWHFVAVIQAH